MSDITKQRYIVLVPRAKYRKVNMFAVSDEDFSDAYDAMFNTFRKDIESGKINFIAKSGTPETVMEDICTTFKRTKVKAQVYDIERDPNAFSDVTL